MHLTDTHHPPPSAIKPTTTTKQVSAEDKKTVLEAVKEALEWVEENAEADADEFNDKRKEVRICSFFLGGTSGRRGRFLKGGENSKRQTQTGGASGGRGVRGADEQGGRFWVEPQEGRVALESATRAAPQ